MDDIINISFTKRDPMNSTVVDDATGSMLFEVFTPPWWKLSARSTTIFDAGGEVVAEYERRMVGPGNDRVTLRGVTFRMADWLPPRTWWSG